MIYETTGQTWRSVSKSLSLPHTRMRTCLVNHMITMLHIIKTWLQFQVTWLFLTPLSIVCGEGGAGVLPPFSPAGQSSPLYTTNGAWHSVGPRPISSWSGWKEETGRRWTGRKYGYRSLWVRMGCGGGGWVHITTDTHGGVGRGYGRVGTHGGGSLASHTPHNLRRGLVITLYLIRFVLFTYVIQSLTFRIKVCNIIVRS